jgi:hypothetical protein
VQKVFGKDFEIELENMKLENSIREKDPGLLEKSGPYYRPVSVMKYQKDTQLELEKSKNGGGENLGGDQPRKEGVTNPGRPSNLKDTKTRKVRTPKVLAIMKTTAENFMEELDNLIDPIFLNKNNCKNIRSLGKDQKEELNNIKFIVLSNLNHDSVLNGEEINKIISETDNSRVNEFFNIFKELKNDYTTIKNRVPTFKELRSLAASVWALMNSDD